jgi:hypothetical protein
VPVRSLSSAVFKWPDRERVLAAARAWAADVRAGDAAVREVYCVGSYARGNWGVGSDVDLVVIVAEPSLDRFKRYRRFEPPRLPVPADVLVYTQAEWESLARDRSALWQEMNAVKIDLLAPATSG